MARKEKPTFEDRLPFKDREPDDIRHLGMTPSAAEAAGVVTGDPSDRAALVGRRGEYRLAFQSMRVPGLPKQISIGTVNISQVDGPIWTQRTHIVQLPGWRPVYEKWMEHVSVGEGYCLTVCTMDVDLTPNMSEGLIRWRDETLAALSLVVALFDERIAQRELAEDVIAEGIRPGDKATVIDTRIRLREFTPASRVTRHDRAAIQRLAGVDTTVEDPVFAAARWYLRAAQTGPTPDAIVFFWTALEALSKPPWGTKRSKQEKKRSDVDWVEQALEHAGLDVSSLAPDMGRLAGLRAEIVHGGVEAPALLREGYYALEAAVRFLLRSRFNQLEAGWPVEPGIPNLRAPFKAIALLAHSRPKIRWRRANPAAE